MEQLLRHGRIPASIVADEIIGEAKLGDVAFLVVGDPLGSARAEKMAAR